MTHHLLAFTQAQVLLIVWCNFHFGCLHNGYESHFLFWLIPLTVFVFLVATNKAPDQSQQQEVNREEETQHQVTQVDELNNDLKADNQEQLQEQKQHPSQQQEQAKGENVQAAEAITQTPEKISQNHKTRTRIVREIVESERNYSHALQEMSERWEQPLIERLKTHPVLSEKEIHTIFSIVDGKSRWENLNSS